MNEVFEKNLALIGAGYWGKNLARNFHSLGALHTICDSSEGTLDKFEELYPDTHCTSNFNAVLDNPEITRLAIAAPAVAHFELATRALKAGKDVYVEKPLCLDCTEAEALIALAKAQGRILMVGHLLQYHPCVKKLQELLANGDLGKLQYIVSNRLNLGKIRTEENALWNFAPHDVSVILSLCGGHLPTQVRCIGAAYLSKGVADTSMTTLKFAEDLRAHIYVSWLNPYKEQKLVVVGSGGMAVFDDTREWDDKLLLYRDHVRWSEGNIPQVEKRDGERVDVPFSEPLKEECRHFLTCCNERLTPRTDGAEGLRVLRVLQAAQASLDTDGASKDPRELHNTTLANKPEYFAHSSAAIDAGCEIGAGTQIWHYSHIMAGSKIGPSCKIGQNVVVSPGVTLGGNCKVQNNVSIYTGVHCESDVFLGPSAVFTNITNPRAEVVRRDQYVETHVRKGATIGANSTIVCGVELGSYCFVGAGAVVTKEVKPYALVMGNPARRVGWMSRHGMRLDLPESLPAGESREATCSETGERYRLEGDMLTVVGAPSSKPTLATPKARELATHG